MPNKKQNNVISITPNKIQIKKEILSKNENNNSKNFKPGFLDDIEKQNPCNMYFYSGKINIFNKFDGLCLSIDIITKSIQLLNYSKDTENDIRFNLVIEDNYLLSIKNGNEFYIKNLIINPNSLKLNKIKPNLDENRNFTSYLFSDFLEWENFEKNSNLINENELSFIDYILNKIALASNNRIYGILEYRKYNYQIESCYNPGFYDLNGKTLDLLIELTINYINKYFLENKKEEKIKKIYQNIERNLINLLIILKNHIRNIQNQNFYLVDFISDDNIKSLLCRLNDLFIFILSQSKIENNLDID